MAKGVVCLSLDEEIIEEINSLTNKEKKSSFINNILKRTLYTKKGLQDIISSYKDDLSFLEERLKNLDTLQEEKAKGLSIAIKQKLSNEYAIYLRRPEILPLRLKVFNQETGNFFQKEEFLLFMRWCDKWSKEQR